MSDTMVRSELRVVTTGAALGADVEGVDSQGAEMQRSRRLSTHGTITWCCACAASVSTTCN